MYVILPARSLIVCDYFQNTFLKLKQVKEEGYLIEHAGKCVTVFSAPNYCDQV